MKIMFLFGMCNCTVDRDVGTVHCLLVQRISHMFGHMCDCTCLRVRAIHEKLFKLEIKSKQHLVHASK